MEPILVDAETMTSTVDIRDQEASINIYLSSLDSLCNAVDTLVDKAGTQPFQPHSKVIHNNVDLPEWLWQPDPEVIRESNNHLNIHRNSGDQSEIEEKAGNFENFLNFEQTLFQIPTITCFALRECGNGAQDSEIQELGEDYTKEVVLNLNEEDTKVKPGHGNPEDSASANPLVDNLVFREHSAEEPIHPDMDSHDEDTFVLNCSPSEICIDSIEINPNSISEVSLGRCATPTCESCRVSTEPDPAQDSVNDGTTAPISLTNEPLIFETLPDLPNELQPQPLLPTESRTHSSLSWQTVLKSVLTETLTESQPPQQSIPSPLQPPKHISFDLKPKIILSPPPLESFAVAKVPSHLPPPGKSQKSKQLNSKSKRLLPPKPKPISTPTIPKQISKLPITPNKSSSKLRTYAEKSKAKLAFNPTIIHVKSSTSSSNTQAQNLQRKGCPEVIPSSGNPFVSLSPQTLKVGHQAVNSPNRRFRSNSFCYQKLHDTGVHENVVEEENDTNGTGYLNLAAIVPLPIISRQKSCPSVCSFDLKRIGSSYGLIINPKSSIKLPGNKGTGGGSLLYKLTSFFSK